MATPHTIAVAGKGGVGKTTTCGMIIDYLCGKKDGPVLVVDADANANLNEVLGVDVETSLGQIREEMAQAELKGTLPAGMTKADYADFKFSSAIIEEDDFDMLVMGRTQGKGCYCFVNGVLKTQVDKYAKNYSYIVMDNEAGLEHVARGTLPKVDTMLLISYCSRRGIQAAARVAELVREMELQPTRMGLIVNRAPEGELDAGIKEEIAKHGLELLGVLVLKRSRSWSLWGVWRWKESRSWSFWRFWSWDVQKLELLGISHLGPSRSFRILALGGPRSWNFWCWGDLEAGASGGVPSGDLKPVLKNNNKNKQQKVGFEPTT